MLLTEDVENDDLSRFEEDRWNGKFVFGSSGGFVGWAVNMAARLKAPFSPVTPRWAPIPALITDESDHASQQNGLAAA